MFCSNQCLDEFRNCCEKFNELKFSNSYYDVVIPPLFKALRISGGYEELHAIYTDPKSSTIFDYDLRDLQSPETQRNLLKCAASFSQRKEDNTFVSNVVRKAILEFREKIFRDIPMRSAEALWRFSVRHFLTGVNNVVGFNDDERAYLLLTSLINHSCDSNLQLTLVDSKALLFTNRPVKADEQLFIKYR